LHKYIFEIKNKGETLKREKIYQFLKVFMSIGLCDIVQLEIFICCDFVWFGSVSKIKIANQTKSYGWIKKSDLDTSKSIAAFLQLQFEFVQFAVFYWKYHIKIE